MEPKRLGLIQSLFFIVNENKIEDPDYILAKYFLEHYTSLGDLNIHDVAEECFVSRSSVRRFSQQIGYENFKDLKEEFKKFDYQYNYFMKFAQNDQYQSWLIQELKDMANELEHTFDQNKVEQIARKIHDSKEVIFLSSYSTLMELMEFQRPLILSGKLIKIMSDQNLNIDQLHALNENDFLVTVSASGMFAELISPVLDSVKAHKLLITASRAPSFLTFYDEIFYLSEKDYTNVKSIYGKYGLMFLFDLLYSVYIRNYGVDI